MKVLRVWISRLTTVLLTTLLILLAITVIISKATGGEPQIFGYQLKTVLSGSMEPTFMTGSIIAVKPGGDMTRFQEGDVITFQKEEDMLVTHRVIEVTKNSERVMYRTQGDNNEEPDGDLVLSQNVVAEYTGFTIPYAGSFFAFTSSSLGGALMLIIPGLVLIGYSGVTIWRTLSDLEKGQVNSSEIILTLFEASCGNTWVQNKLHTQNG